MNSDLSPQLLRGMMVAGLVALGLVATSMFGIIGGLVPPVIILTCFLIGRPRSYLFAFWIWAVIGELVLFLLRRPVLENVSLALDAGLLILLLATHVLNRRPIFTSRPVTIVTAGLLFITVISFWANRPPPIAAVHFVLAYFRFLLVFLYTMYFLKAGDAKRLYLVLIATLALQFIPNMGWLIRLNPIPNPRMGSADFAVGTIQSCNGVAYLSIACICVLLPAILGHRQKRRERQWAIAALIMAVTQLWFSYTVHAYILAIICSGIYLIIMSVRWQTRLAVAALGLALIVLAIPMMTEATSRSYKRGIQHQLNMEYITFRWNRMLSGVKGQAYKNVLLRSHRDMSFPALGAGPGNFGSAIARTYRRPLADRYFNYVAMADSYQYHKLSHGGSITGIPYSGMLAIWSELGPLGYLLYWGLHLYAMWHIWRQVRRGGYEDLYRSILAQGFCLTMLTWLILNFMSDFCHVRLLHGGLWIWAAVVWNPDHERLHKTDSGSRGGPHPQRATVPVAG